MSAILPFYFCLFYFTIQRVPLAAPATLEPTIFDSLIPFEPRWTIVYQSLYLFLPLPWLCESALELRRYVRAFLAVTAVAFLCFVAFPVAGPRPAVMPDDALYRLVVSYDRNVNTVPSLHVALTVLTLLLALRLLRSAVARWAALIWAALIIYSTMATKQHWAIDVAAGFVLAIVADLFSRITTRTERKSSYASTPAWLDSPSPGDRRSAAGRR